MGHKEVYQQAIKAWGEDLQVLMVFEEMSELQKALCKYLRRKTSYDLTAIIDELADVEIMVEQMKVLFKCEREFKIVKEHKISRLIDRLNTRTKE